MTQTELRKRSGGGQVFGSYICTVSTFRNSWIQAPNEVIDQYFICGPLPLGSVSSVLTELAGKLCCSTVAASDNNAVSLCVAFQQKKASNFCLVLPEKLLSFPPAGPALVMCSPPRIPVAREMRSSDWLRSWSQDPAFEARGRVAFRP